MFLNESSGITRLTQVLELLLFWLTGSVVPQTGLRTSVNQETKQLCNPDRINKRNRTSRHNYKYFGGRE